MAQPVRDVPTFEELYAQIQRMAEHLTGEILEPGVIRVMSRPGASHQFALRRIVRSLGAADVMEGGLGWWLEIEREIRLGDRLAVPDVAGWRADDAPAFVEDNPISVVPDWCCEILSPSTAREDRLLKLPLYARSGVGWVWLVDPDARSVEVFETREGVPALVRNATDEEEIVLPPFEGSIHVGGYWKPKAALTDPG